MKSAVLIPFLLAVAAAAPLKDVHDHSLAVRHDPEHLQARSPALEARGGGDDSDDDDQDLYPPPTDQTGYDADTEHNQKRSVQLLAPRMENEDGEVDNGINVNSDPEYDSDLTDDDVGSEYDSESDGTDIDGDSEVDDGEEKKKRSLIVRMENDGADEDDPGEVDDSRPDLNEEPEDPDFEAEDGWTDEDGDSEIDDKKRKSRRSVDVEAETKADQKAHQRVGNVKRGGDDPNDPGDTIWGGSDDRGDDSDGDTGHDSDDDCGAFC